MTQEKKLARASRCVCKYCGSRLKIEEIIHNQYGGSSAELFCPKCKKVEYGTEKEIYLVAKDFVDHAEFQYFNDLEDEEQAYKMNVAKICEILSYCLGELKLLDNYGLFNRRL